jgi:phage repressor protein C with HTH and peptisase S24 domain
MINREEQAEFIKTLRDKLRLSQRRFGKELNVSGAYIAQVEAGQSNLSEKVYNLIQEKYNYLTDDKQADAQPKIKAEYYPDVLGSCGGGAFELSQEHYTVELPVDCFFKEISKNKTYSVINAYGDSMLETIKDGDKLIIEHTESEPIQDNKIYVFCYDNQIYVKRLINNIDELVVVSDNPDKTIYKTKYISKADRDNLYLIGQVVGLARNLR